MTLGDNINFTGMQFAINGYFITAGGTAFKLTATQTSVASTNAVSRCKRSIPELVGKPALGDQQIDHARLIRLQQQFLIAKAARQRTKVDSIIADTGPSRLGVSKRGPA